VCIALYGKRVAELQSITCHMKSHRIPATRHKCIQVLAYLAGEGMHLPCLILSQAGRYLIYLPWKEERLSYNSYGTLAQT